VNDADDVAACANYAADPAAAPVAAAPAAPAAAAPVAPVAAAVAAPIPAAVAAPAAAGGRVFASPLARKLAREAGLDVAALRVPGSGPGGRIVAADVLRAAALPAEAAAGTVATTATAAAAAVVAGIPMVTATAPLVSAGEGYSDFELSALSSALAARLAAAKQQVPHYYLSVELDLTKLLQLRAELNGSQVASSSSGVS
jgi:pyruvate dehydrogenase E2 component (dihydrolipoamide acetyltransferase)